MPSQELDFSALKGVTMDKDTAAKATPVKTVKTGQISFVVESVKLMKRADDDKYAPGRMYLAVRVREKESGNAIFLEPSWEEHHKYGADQDVELYVGFAAALGMLTSEIEEVAEALVEKVFRGYCQEQVYVEVARLPEEHQDYYIDHETKPRGAADKVTFTIKNEEDRNFMIANGIRMRNKIKDVKRA